MIARHAWIPILAAACAAAPQDSAPAPGEGGRAAGGDYAWHQGHFNLLIGSRELEHAAWGGLDSQPTLGLTVDAGADGAWANWDFGLLWSYDDTRAVVGPGMQQKLRTWSVEATIGMIKYFGIPGTVLRPYLGGGLSLAYSDAQLVNQAALLREGSDSTAGGYVRAGLGWEFRRGNIFGIDARYLAGTDLDFGDVSTDLDGLTISLIFGFAF